MVKQFSTVIVDSDAQSIELQKLYIKDLEYVQIVGEFGNITSSCKQIIELEPNIIIIDISEDTNESLAAISKITSALPDCKILVTSTAYTTENAIKILRAGAKEFLPKPLIKDSFLNTLNDFNGQLSGTSKENKKCRVITTFSNKGGIGKTTIAVNLALELANMTKEKVALIDLNLHMGDVTTFLDVNPPFDISYITQNLSKVDEKFLMSSLEKYKETDLYILAEPPFLEQSKDIKPSQISRLIETLRETFSYVVIDTSSNFDERTIAALDSSDLILLVSIVNLPAIRNCQRCLSLFDRLGYEKEKTRVILNRYMENDEIRVEDVEDVLKQKVYWKIPNNYFTIMSSINKGMPVGSVNAESNVAQSYRGLAAMLSDNIYKQNYARKFLRQTPLNLSNLLKEQ